MEGDVSLQLPHGSAVALEGTRARHERAHDEFAEAVLDGLRAA